MTDREVLFAAWTVRGEAEGEGHAGMVAVAWAIRNRVDRPRWPDDVIGVCLDDFDFSFWNSDSQRRAEVCSAYDALHWEAVEIVSAVWRGEIPDPTGGSDHYYSVDISSEPYWVPSLTFVLQIGKHRFYTSRAPETPSE